MAGAVGSEDLTGRSCSVAEPAACCYTHPSVLTGVTQEQDRGAQCASPSPSSPSPGSERGQDGRRNVGNGQNRSQSRRDGREPLRPPQQSALHTAR